MASKNNLKRAPYRTNGSAAYDVRANYSGTAAPKLPPQQQPNRLPEEQRRPSRHVRVKAKAAISPFAIFGLAAATCMLVLVVFGYVQLYEATTDTQNLRDELEDLTYTNTMLHSEYEGKIDLASVEQRATQELGMIQPTAGQTVYLNLSGSDRAIITQEVKTNVFVNIIEAIKDSFSGLVSYLT